ncbi:MAG TPA: M48 family metalloprotease [Methylophilaceae bacterium]
MRIIYLLTLLTALLTPVAMAEGLPDLGDYAQSVLTPLQEQRIGEEAMRDIRASNTLVDDIEITDYISALGYKLVTNSPDNRQTFTFFVLSDPVINAFALPGGFIGIHTGLIQNTRSESELASVMSHEIGHVVQRHMARMVADQKRNTLPSLAMMAASLLLALGSPQLGQGALISTEAGMVQHSLAFSRENEQEADRVGMQILDKSGFDTRAMPAFFETLLKSERFDGNAPSFLRTHPLSTERISDMRNRAEQTPYRQVPDSIEFSLVRAKLRAMQGTPNDTVRYFEDSLREKKYSDEVAQRYGLAVALLRARDLEQAQQELDKVSAMTPRHPMLESLRANILIAQNKTQEALALYSNALKLFPKSRGLIYGNAEALLSLNKPREALVFLEKGQQEYPEDDHLYELQSQAYTQQGKNLQRHRTQGEAYFRAYDLPGAIEQMELAVKAGDDDFYQRSIVEARLKQLRQQQEDTKTKD